MRLVADALPSAMAAHAAYWNLVGGAIIAWLVRYCVKYHPRG